MYISFPAQINQPASGSHLYPECSGVASQERGRREENALLDPWRFWSAFSWSQLRSQRQHKRRREIKARHREPRAAAEKRCSKYLSPLILCLSVHGAGFAKNWPAGPDQTPLTPGLSMEVGQGEGRARAHASKREARIYACLPLSCVQEASAVISI